MKKFTKISLILAAVLAVAGIAFCVAGFVCGVDYEKLREIPLYRDRRTTVTEESGKIEFSETYAGIRSLELDIGVTEMKITDSADDKFHVYGSNLGSSFQCRQDGDSLEIESKGKLWIDKNLSEKVTVEVPEGTVFEDVDMTVGIGSLEAENLQCGELSIDCGVGSVFVNGSVREDCEIDCGVGEVSLNLVNLKDEFNYDIQCGIGEVILGENSYSGISKTKEIDNGADKDMDIECGVGSVMVTFGEE
jgi:hypothetical protein